jgi:4-hydroxy-tetrahydrodipicolinate reductase
MSGTEQLLRIAVSGIGGRMGGGIAGLVQDATDLTLVAGIDRPGATTSLGVLVAQSVREIPNCDVVIDFSSADHTPILAASAAEFGIALVTGTTGLDEAQRDELNQAAQQVPVVYAPNMSLGVNLLYGLVDLVARSPAGDWDIELTEAHHKHKVDAPSGTARRILDLLAEARGQSPDAEVYGREGETGPRTPNEVGVHVIRGGDVVGDHSVVFLGEGERIELTHRATDRLIFCRGAIHAARWIAGRPPGMYSMQNVLGL